MSGSGVWSLLVALSPLIIHPQRPVFCVVGCCLSPELFFVDRLVSMRLFAVSLGWFLSVCVAVSWPVLSLGSIQLDLPLHCLIRLAWFFALPRSFCGLDVYRCLSSRLYLVRPCSVSTSCVVYCTLWDCRGAPCRISPAESGVVPPQFYVLCSLFPLSYCG